MKNLDKIEAMKVFSEVAKKRSFTTTADNLNLSKAKVTRYIRELEDWLDCRLLQRTTRKVSLTPAGEESLKQINSIISSCEALKVTVAYENESPKGNLRISTSSAFGEAFLGDIISLYLEEYPQVNIELIIDDKCLNLVEHRFDLALRTSSELNDSLIARPLAKDRTLLCASPTYIKKFGEPTHPNQLEDHKVLLCTTFKQFDKWIFQKGHTSIEAEIESAFHSNNVRVLKRAATTGAGIARLPSFLAAPLIEEGKLCHILTDWQTLEVTLWAVYVSRDYQPASVRTFIDFTVNHFNKIKNSKSQENIRKSIQEIA